MKNKELLLFGILILIITFTRCIIPSEMYNISPMAAVVLFAAVMFSNKKQAFAISFTSLLLSDIILGIHNTMLFTYLSFAIIFMIGKYFSPNSVPKVVAISLVGSILFYFITNTGYWMMNMPNTGIGGLITALIDGLPFFRNTIIGDLSFNTILFGIAYFYNYAIKSRHYNTVIA